MSEENRDEKIRYATHMASLPSTYAQDGLVSVHNHEFMNDPAYVAAYARGVKAAGMNYGWYWRVHIGLWAAFAKYFPVVGLACLLFNRASLVVRFIKTVTNKTDGFFRLARREEAA